MNTAEFTENIVAGRQIANWKFVRLLGRGGMATVFEVEDTRLGTRAALKLFSCAKDANGDVRTRFLAEATLLARLHHPRLVRVFDYGIDPVSNSPYFVMDLVLAPSGNPKTLADKEFAGADESHVAMWYDDLRDALAFIHARGIVHRDIKLQNVLVGPDGHAVLSDFGVAKIFDMSLREAIGLSPEATLHAAKGRRTVMGSLGYLAPELEMGVVASPASDYYALGVLVFYLLTGTWCEPRTNLTEALATYDPVWMDILPKLLHATPAARACPSWRELENQRRETEIAQAEEELALVDDKLRKTRRNQRLTLLAAVVLGTGFLATMVSLPFRQHPLETVDICAYPPSAPDDLEVDEDSLDNDSLLTARGYICEYIAKINRGEMSRQAVADELMKRASDDSLLLDSYVTYLYKVSASNLLHKVQK